MSVTIQKDISSIKSISSVSTSSTNPLTTQLNPTKQSSTPAKNQTSTADVDQAFEACSFSAVLPAWRRISQGRRELCKPESSQPFDRGWLSFTAPVLGPAAHHGAQYRLRLLCALGADSRPSCAADDGTAARRAPVLRQAHDRSRASHRSAQDLNLRDTQLAEELKIPLSTVSKDSATKRWTWESVAPERTSSISTAEVYQASTEPRPPPAL